MEDEKYRYLFPFEKIKPNSNVLIYGAGVVGMEYLKQIDLTENFLAMGVDELSVSASAILKVRKAVRDI